jgi:hypothetical protein
MPQDSDFLCGGWIWDPVLRELRYHERARKGWKDEPEQVERLRPVAAVTWHRWSQAPMQTTTGAMAASSHSRVVVAFEGGGDITLTEPVRDCAGRLAAAIAGAFGLAVVEAGAPDGRRRGNLPARDAMGRLVARRGKLEVTLDETAREIVVARRRFPAGRSRRRYSYADVRRLELTYEVKGPLETFTVWALAGTEEEKLPLAAYEGYEGWADPDEWRDFALELGRSLGVEVSGAGPVSGL